ncbi:MAG: peptidylprolyl isomerase [Gemmatimonadaceae bacterium]|nr:peptidylprolyl isomerase [Gemmatimonadaceae bacterium]
MVLQSMRSVAKYIWWFLVLAFVGSFLLYETSGLSGRSPVTTSTAVATVNGQEVLLTSWQNAVSSLEQQEQQRLGRGITLDERRTLEDRAYDELVNEVLLQQEFKRRGITVTDEEILEAARVAPPPQAMQSPDLQTDGQFDIKKYQRLLASSVARQSGMLVGLESYYRTEIPKQKLFDQIAADVYVSDERLWQIYKDRHDTAQVSYILLRPESLTDSAVTVTDAEIGQFYERNRKRFDRPGRAVVSLVSVPRSVTAADSADAKSRIEKIRAEIAGGVAFEDVAKRESNDSVSGANGGSLGKIWKGRMTPKFEDAAYALKPGELSQPVLTPFGWHLIKVESHKGDTLDARHILINIGQSDSSATRTDRRADSLASKAANQQDPKKFDEATKALGLTPTSIVAIEREPLNFAGRVVPSVSAWAFSGAAVGESSDLFDSPEAYYVARLDSLVVGGAQPLSEVRDDILRRLTRDKRIEKLRPLGVELMNAAKASTLEGAATAKQLTVETTQAFTRIDPVPGLGQFNQAIGASFTIPVGQSGGPVAAADGMAVIRVNRRAESVKTAFETQKSTQRSQLTQSLRQQRVEEYLNSLRESVKIQDHRAKVNAQLRKQSAGV